MGIRKIALVAALAIATTTAVRYGLPTGVAAKEPGQAILVNSVVQEQAGAPVAPTATISPANSEDPSGAELPSKAQSDEAEKPAAERMIAQVYSLPTADLERMMKELRPLLPEAQINADTAHRMLVVVASEEDHKRVQAVLESAERQGETKLREAGDGSLSESSSGSSLRMWVVIGSGMLILLFGLIVACRKLRA